MKEHKLRQLLFNRIGSFDDSLNQLNYSVVSTNNDIIAHTVAYFTKPSVDLVYPSKSFAVAIIYGHLLEKQFQDDFFESLNDPDLFCGNDKFFVPYQESPTIYDQILKEIGYGPNFVLNTKLPQIEKSVRYFNQEFSFTGQV